MRNELRLYRFASPRPVEPGGPDLAVHVEPGAQHRRVARAARNLPRHAAGRGHAADLPRGTDAVAVDGAPEVIELDEPVLHHLQAGLVVRRGPLHGIEVVVGIRPPLPFEPQLPRLLGVQVRLDRESHVAREVLRALADEEMVVGRLHDGFGDERRRPDAFEARHAPGPFLGPVHAAGIELDDAVGVRQAAEPDARVGRVQFAEIDAGDQGVEHVRPAGHQGERLRHTGDVAPVPVDVPVVGRDDDGAHRLPHHHRRGLGRRHRRGCCGLDRGGAHDGCGTGHHELATVHSLRHASLQC